MRVYVAAVVPFSDGTGEAAVLGVYSTVDAAQARCWREVEDAGYFKATTVVGFTVDDVGSKS